MKKTHRIMLFTAFISILILPVTLFIDKTISPNCMFVYTITLFLTLVLGVSVPSIRAKIETLFLLILASTPVLPYFPYIYTPDYHPKFQHLPNTLPATGLLFVCTLYILILQFQHNRGTQLYEKKQNATTKDICNFCGSHMRPEDIFCKNCQTITPKVREMLARYPNKMPDEYYPHSGHKGLLCPHCRSKYLPNLATVTYGSHLGSPIRCCTKCKNYILDLQYVEWSIANNKFRKRCCSTLSIFLCSTLLVFVSMAFYFSMLVALMVAIVYIAMYIILSIIWHKIANKEIIESSYLRLKRNPDYPQILADMGYGPAMDEKYRHLVKYHRPKLTLKEILKDAFTFD